MIVSMDDLKRKIIENIQEYGLSIISVGPDPDDGTPPFSYSIGLSLIGKYELLVEGLQPDLGQYLINQTKATFSAYGIPIDHTCIVKGLVQGDLPMAFVKTDTGDLSETRSIQVGHMLDIEVYGVLQLIIPDPSGLFPWEEGCDTSIGDQTIHRRDSSPSALRELMSESPYYDLSSMSIDADLVKGAVSAPPSSTRH